MNLDDFADILKSRECKTLQYFHTDHFEPWSSSIDDESARAVDRMAEMARTSPYARKLSLFYSVFIPYRLKTAENPQVEGARVPGDSIVFGPHSARQEELARQAIRPLVAADQHEIHLHVHHEFWTRNTSDFDHPVSRWVNAHSTPAADQQRLDLNFRLCKEVIAREIGAPFERWAFIHGNWALNASDPLICHIDNEMDMLMRHGGFGDFSFPAGRGYCDPKLETPFTCLPLDLPRAYDDPSADPRPIGAGTGVVRPDRFFIWNSPIKSNYSSLDYYSQSNRDLFKTPERIVRQWLEKCVVLDHRLFLKTHAHSMKWEYKIAEPGSVIPHRYPDVATIFDLLARVCDRARVELQLVTVNEVMELLREFDACRIEPRPAANIELESVARPSFATGAVRSTELDATIMISNVATNDPPKIHGDVTQSGEPAEPSGHPLRESDAKTAPCCILTKPFIADGGAAWRATLPTELHSLTDTDEAPSYSPLRLLEDGVALGPGHALHQLIRQKGGGLYSFWKRELWFSTSGGDDPNVDGHVYSVTWDPATAPAPTPQPAVIAGAVPAPLAAVDLAAMGDLVTVRGRQGVLFSVFGDRQLQSCPVCHSTQIEPLWRMPMANLKDPISLFGGYFNQVPTLQVPGVIYCFDFCYGCESIFLNPVPAAQKEQYRTTDHYVRKMETAAEWQGYEDVYNTFARWIPADATVMIDAACGIGQYLHVARKRATHQWRRMIGLELAEKYVAHMHEQGLEAYAFDVDNDDLLAVVEPNSIDFITFCEAFEHVERPLDALRKLLAVLRPGGRLYFTAQRYGTDVQAAVRPGEPIYIGEKVVKEIPQRLGCRIVDVSTSGMRYYVVLEKQSAEGL